MNREEFEQKKIRESQGVRLHSNDLVLKPKNRIEAALEKNRSENFLPSLNDKTYNQDIPSYAKPLSIEPEVPRSFEAIAPKPKNPNKYRKIKFLTRLSLIFLLVILVGGAVLYGGYKGIKSISSTKSSSESMNKDTSTLLADVGKLVTLPAGEDPSVFTVADLAPLKNQAFFNEAKIGDKVLIFSKSKKAVLYRPSENRVIVMAPLNN